MRVRTYSRRIPQDIAPAKQTDAAGFTFKLGGINKDQRIGPRKVYRKVKTRRAEVYQLHVLKIVLRFKHLDGERSDAIIAHQNIPYTPDPDFSHRTFTRAISRPDGSNVWQAHAIQGSNECTVRSSSRGRSGSATGFRISEASYGPTLPCLSRG